MTGNSGRGVLSMLLHLHLIRRRASLHLRCTCLHYGRLVLLSGAERLHCIGVLGLYSLILSNRLLGQRWPSSLLNLRLKLAWLPSLYRHVCGLRCRYLFCCAERVSPEIGFRLSRLLPLLWHMLPNFWLPSLLAGICHSRIWLRGFRLRIGGLAHLCVNCSRLLFALKFFNSFDDLDSMEPDFDPKILFKVCVCHMVNDLSVNSDVLYLNSN
jgi:hypothetical protein